MDASIYTVFHGTAPKAAMVTNDSESARMWMTRREEEVLRKQGEGGLGKTVLASSAVRTKGVVDGFPGGAGRAANACDRRQGGVLWRGAASRI